MYKPQNVFDFFVILTENVFQNLALADPVRDQGLTCELEMFRKCLIFISVYLNQRKI